MFSRWTRPCLWVAFAVAACGAPAATTRTTPTIQGAKDCTELQVAASAAFATAETPRQEGEVGVRAIERSVELGSPASSGSALSMDELEVCVEVNAAYESHLSALIGTLTNDDIGTPAVGTCLAELPGPVVDCAEPHRWEVVGPTSYLVGFTAIGPRQSPDVLWVVHGPSCTSEAVKYANPNLSSDSATVIGRIYRFPTEEQWESGFQQSQCAAALIGPNGLVDVRTGSLAR